MISFYINFASLIFSCGVFILGPIQIHLNPLPITTSGMDFKMTFFSEFYQLLLFIYIEALNLWVEMKGRVGQDGWDPCTAQGQVSGQKENNTV